MEIKIFLLIEVHFERIPAAIGTGRETAEEQ